MTETNVGFPALYRRLLLSSVTADRLNLPSILVLHSCGISRAGDQAEIAAFCSHVMEVDLSHNKLQDWNEVLFLQLPGGLCLVISRSLTKRLQGYNFFRSMLSPHKVVLLHNQIPQNMLHSKKALEFTLMINNNLRR